MYDLQKTIFCLMSMSPPRSCKSSFYDSQLFGLTYVRHVSDRLPSVAVNILGLRDIRDVANPAHLPQLESRLRNLYVRVVEAGKIGRRKVVKKLIQSAGHYTFHTQDGTSTTVRVSRVWNTFNLLWFWTAFFRSIIWGHTTIVCYTLISLGFI